MRIQLNVIKSDGTAERYLHTKIMGTIANALANAGLADTAATEDLADAVTYYLYHHKKQRKVTSNEILFIIKAVLTSTAHNDAATALSDHYYTRKLKRTRTEVITADINDLADAEQICHINRTHPTSPWNKSIIATDLTEKHDFDSQTARTIAAMVEEKVFKMAISKIPTSLIKQIVLNDAATIKKLQAQFQLT